MPKSSPGNPKFEKKYQNFNIFLKIVFKKIGNKKNLKFKTKKLQKYVIFDVHLRKILFEHFLAPRSNFTKKKYFFHKSRLFV